MSRLDMIVEDLRSSHKDAVTAWVNSQELHPNSRRRPEARLRTLIREQLEELSDADFLAVLDGVRPIFVWRKYLRRGYFSGKQLFLEMVCADIMERLVFAAKFPA